MKNIINRLLTIKSIVTIALTGVFVFLSATGKINTTDFNTLYLMIIAFYFGTQKGDENK